MVNFKKLIRKSQMECLFCGIPLVYKNEYKHNHLTFYRIFIKYTDNTIDYGYICIDCLKSSIPNNSIKYIQTKQIL